MYFLLWGDNTSSIGWNHAYVIRVHGRRSVKPSSRVCIDAQSSVVRVNGKLTSRERVQTIVRQDQSATRRGKSCWTSLLGVRRDERALTRIGDENADARALVVESKPSAGDSCKMQKRGKKQRERERERYWMLRNEQKKATASDKNWRKAEEKRGKHEEERATMRYLGHTLAGWRTWIIQSQEKIESSNLEF